MQKCRKDFSTLEVNHLHYYPLLVQGKVLFAHVKILARHRLQLPPNQAGGTPVTAAGETVSKWGPQQPTVSSVVEQPKVGVDKSYSQLIASFNHNLVGSRARWGNDELNSTLNKGRDKQRD